MPSYLYAAHALYLLPSASATTQAAGNTNTATVIQWWAACGQTASMGNSESKRRLGAHDLTTLSSHGTVGDRLWQLQRVIEGLKMVSEPRPFGEVSSLVA